MPTQNRQCTLCGINGNGRQIRFSGEILRCRATHPEDILSPQNCRIRQLERQGVPPPPEIADDILVTENSAEDLENYTEPVNMSDDDDDSSDDEGPPPLVSLEYNDIAELSLNLPYSFVQQNNREALIDNPDLGDRVEMTQIINTVLMSRLVELTVENSRLSANLGPDNNIKDGLNSALEKIEQEKGNMPEGCYLKMCDVLQDVWKIVSKE